MRPGEAYPDSHVSWVAPVEGAGVPAVLKIPMPVDVSVGTLAGDCRDQEPAALALWSGRGAPELLRHDTASGAMLLEQCVPGRTLETLESADAADEAAAALLDLLHRPAPVSSSLLRLADRAAMLAAELPARFGALEDRFDHRLLEDAVEGLIKLSEPPAIEVILHGDTHHHNILSSRRQPWLAIDPLPMIGDPAYDAVQYLLFRKGDLTDPATQWSTVISRFCRLLGVDAERVKTWIFVRLVSDALAACERGDAPDDLERRQADLWTARLVRRI